MIKYIRDLQTSYRKNKIRSKINSPYIKENDDLKAIFIHIPKNAGISIEEAIFGRKVGHHRMIEYCAFDEKKFKEYYKFTVVRNPFDRLVSAFFFLKAGGRNENDRMWALQNLFEIDSFEEFIDSLKRRKRFFKNTMKHLHFLPQYYFLEDFNGNIPLDKTIHFEKLNDGFFEVCNDLNIKGKKLEHKNKSKRSDWNIYYDDNTKDFVYNIYKKDFKEFYPEV